jgi:splicing factor 3B subunit 2
LCGEIKEAKEEVEEEEEALEDVDCIPMDKTIEPSGLETPSGIASAVPSGFETPNFLEPRKSRFDVVPEPQTREQRDLYRVLPEAQKKKGFLGSTGYDISQPTLEEDIATNVIPPPCLWQD